MNMYRPLFGQSSGRCVTQDGYFEMLQQFVKSGTDVKYQVSKTHSLK